MEKTFIIICTLGKKKEEKLAYLPPILVKSVRQYCWFSTQRNMSILMKKRKKSHIFRCFNLLIRKGETIQI